MNEIQTINNVLGMLNSSENPLNKSQLMEKGKEIGYKPVTMNYCVKKLKEANCINIIENDGDKMYEVIKNEYPGQNKSKKIMKTQRYRTKTSNYKGEIPELTAEQEELKDKVTSHRDELFGKKIIWTDKNGATFPLKISGMGDVTLKCRFFLKDFMEFEPITGAVIYIPWHEPSIVSQINEQIEELLQPEEDFECVILQAPAK